MGHIVNPYGVSPHAHQKSWSKDSCSIEQSFSTVNEDLSDHLKSMNLFTGGAILYVTNVQTQNQKILNHSSSNSQTLDLTFQVEQPTGNLATCGVDTRSYTPSTNGQGVRT